MQQRFVWLQNHRNSEVSPGKKGIFFVRVNFFILLILLLCWVPPLAVLKKKKKGSNVTVCEPMNKRRPKLDEKFQCLNKSSCRVYRGEMSYTSVVVVVVVCTITFSRDHGSALHTHSPWTDLCLVSVGSRLALRVGNSSCESAISWPAGGRREKITHIYNNNTVRRRSLSLYMTLLSRERERERKGFFFSFFSLKKKKKK